MLSLMSEGVNPQLPQALGEVTPVEIPLAGW
jgi:hypothetical protein